MENPYFIDFDTIEEANAKSQLGMTISDLSGQDCLALRIGGEEIARWAIPYVLAGESLNLEPGPWFTLTNN